MAIASGCQNVAKSVSLVIVLYILRDAHPVPVLGLVFLASMLWLSANPPEDQRPRKETKITTSVVVQEGRRCRMLK